CLEGCQQPRRVVECWPNEDIEVAGEAGSTVEGKRVRADNNEFNPMGSQGPDKLVEVGRQIHRFVSAGIRPRQPAPSEGAITSSAKPAASALRRQTRGGARFVADLGPWSVLCSSLARFLGALRMGSLGACSDPA